MILAKVLRGAWRVNPPEPDFTLAELESVLPLLERTRTLALAWWRIRHSPLANTDSGASLHRWYVNQSILAARGAYKVYQYVSALQRENIEPIVFKGWALFAQYAEPGLRPLGDIDLAVAPEQADRATRILRELGATPVDVDVHAGLGDPDHAAYIPDTTWAELVARSDAYSIGKIFVRKMGLEDRVRVVCIHCMRHMAARPIWLCDIAALLENQSNLDWVRILSRPPYTSWIVFAILLARQLLDAQVTLPPTLKNARLPDWLRTEALTRWQAEGIMKKEFHASVFKVWHSPAEWGNAVRVRLPNRFESTLRYHGGLDEPLLARHQLHALWDRWVSFAQRGSE